MFFLLGHRKILYASLINICSHSIRITFKPTRGLRQGDPLSPYLFVLCMKALGQSITWAVEVKAWKPVRIARNGPMVSHIFFADDLLLFGKTSFSQARTMEYILAQFCGISGQRMNRGKSRIWFSPNTPMYLRNSICSEFRIAPTTNLGTYLGMPLVHGRKRKAHYNFLVEKTTRKLAVWKIKTLSKATKIILLSSSLMCLAGYTMQTIAIPKIVLQQLQRINRRFLCGETDGQRRHHSVCWEQICRPKQHEGLGLPSLLMANQYMLAKAFWRMVKEPAELNSSVLIAKYGKWPMLLDGIRVVGASHL